MPILVSQKDKFFDLIENQSAFTPYQFSINEDPFEEEIIFSLKESKYFFSIFPEHGYANSYIVNCSPGEFEFIEEFNSAPINPTVYNFFQKWLENLDREIKAPNKWDRLLKEIESFSVPNNSSYNADKFSYQEYKEITNNVLQLKEGIKEIGLTLEQYNIINEKLDFLIDQSKNLKKFDWRSLFIGTIINIASNIIINPTSIQAFYELVKGFFSKLLM